MYNRNVVLHYDKILHTTFSFKSSKVKQNEAQLRLPKNYLQPVLLKDTVGEKCPNTEFFLVRIFQHWD